MDKLRLNIKANDDLQTDLKDLYDVMNRLSLLPTDFEGKQKVYKW
jgi:ESCRT-I complex subunit VPS28